jgi:hypothetical protein
MSASMYLVVRRALQRDGTPCCTQHGDDTGSRIPLRLFASRAAAEAHAAELARVARRTMNPFHLCDGAVPKGAETTIAALALPLACPNTDWYEEWSAWWDTIQEALSDEQRASAWATFVPTYPFEVCEVSVE